MTRCTRALDTFFLDRTPSTGIYTLSLHDALPISGVRRPGLLPELLGEPDPAPGRADRPLPLLRPRGSRDRKSTRLNSSHRTISYAVFCVKQKESPHRSGALV